MAKKIKKLDSELKEKDIEIAADKKKALDAKKEKEAKKAEQII